MTDANPFRRLVVGTVLAGGLARRMGGGDKPLAEIGGRAMLDRVLDRLAPQVGQMIINANGDPARFNGYGLPVVADPIDGFVGPLAGVLAGLEWARDNTDARFVATIAGDTPFFPDDLVHRFIGTTGHSDEMIALAQSGDQVHPVFGLWPVALAKDLRRFLEAGESRKVLAWVDRHQRADVIFSGMMLDGIAVDPFFNVNTPDDIDTANAIAEVIEEKAA